MTQYLYVNFSGKNNFAFTAYSSKNILFCSPIFCFAPLMFCLVRKYFAFLRHCLFLFQGVSMWLFLRNISKWEKACAFSHFDVLRYLALCPLYEAVCADLGVAFGVYEESVSSSCAFYCVEAFCVVADYEHSVEYCC